MREIKFRAWDPEADAYRYIELLGNIHESPELLT